MKGILLISHPVCGDRKLLLPYILLPSVACQCRSLWAWLANCKPDTNMRTSLLKPFTSLWNKFSFVSSSSLTVPKCMLVKWRKNICNLKDEQINYLSNQDKLASHFDVVVPKGYQCLPTLPNENISLPKPTIPFYSFQHFSSLDEDKGKIVHFLY